MVYSKTWCIRGTLQYNVEHLCLRILLWIGNKNSGWVSLGFVIKTGARGTLFPNVDIFAWAQRAFYSYKRPQRTFIELFMFYDTLREVTQNWTCFSPGNYKITRKNIFWGCFWDNFWPILKEWFLNCLSMMYPLSFKNILIRFIRLVLLGHFFTQF